MTTLLNISTALEIKLFVSFNFQELFILHEWRPHAYYHHMNKRGARFILASKDAYDKKCASKGFHRCLLS